MQHGIPKMVQSGRNTGYCVCYTEGNNQSKLILVLISKKLDVLQEKVEGNILIQGKHHVSNTYTLNATWDSQNGAAWQKHWLLCLLIG